jgi:hypothetical protein
MFYGYESESQMRECNPTIADHLTSIAPDDDLEFLVSSLWAQRFKANCPTDYSEAILRAGEPVDIYESDETGELQWVVSLEDGFWMDAFTSREEAENLVAEMGWPKWAISSQNVEATHDGKGLPTNSESI